MNNYFGLRVITLYNNVQKSYIDLKAYVVNYQDKSRLVFKQAPKTQLIETLIFVKK